MRLASALFAIALFGTSASATRRRRRRPARPGTARLRAPPERAATHTFSRTPAFAWNPVRGASCYEFELATSRTFDGSSVFWSNVSIGALGQALQSSEDQAPATDPASESTRGRATPEIKTHCTDPDPGGVGQSRPPVVHGQAVRALRARPRRHARGATAWSKPFGFNVRWEDTRFRRREPGLVRWTPVEGATAYDVWYPVRRQGHQDAHERRRPARAVLVPPRGQLVADRSLARPPGAAGRRSPPQRPVLPSRTGRGAPYATPNPVWSTGKLHVGSAVSDVSTGSRPPHQLMPAMTFGGDPVSTATSTDSSAPTPSPIATA